MLSDKLVKQDNDLPCYGDIYQIGKIIKQRLIDNDRNKVACVNGDKYWCETNNDITLVTGITRHCMFFLKDRDLLEQGQLVFDIFVNQEYKRTFINDIQINEFCKRIWEKDILAIVEIVPVYREYVEVE
jgi:hypothetical protein